mgnify:CR=1 FL=1
MPEEQPDDQHVNRFRTALEQHESTRDMARSSRVESRDEALAEMTAHIEEGELTKALRSAIRVQDLHEDFDEIFEAPESP